MDNIIALFQEHAKAEAQGMAVDWRQVAARMAAVREQELQAKQVEAGKKADGPDDNGE